MTDAEMLARIHEAERLLHEAVADVPLTCSAQETAAALQGLALKVAETCMTPPQIAHILIAQAEGYLKTARPPEGHGPTDDVIAGAHRVIGDAVEGLHSLGLPAPAVREVLLGYLIAWMGRADPRGSAEMLYRHADAMAGRVSTKH